jgi:outer membrane protein TolC
MAATAHSTNRMRLRGAGGLFLALLTAVAAGQTPIDLQEAIRRARAANAHLPLPAVEVSIAREKRSEALAERWLRVAVEGGFLYAPDNGSGYDPALTNLGEARLQAVVRQPLYSGGALRASADRAGAAVEAAGARYRIAEKDLELEVRSRYSELLAALAEVSTRRDGIERLQSYRSSLRGRQASGQGVATDLLKTEVRLALEEAAISEAQQRQDEARLTLNELMGRPPVASLDLAPLPPPTKPGSATDAAWEGAPEIAAAEAESRVAAADLTVARAERLPHLSLNADAGFWASDTTHLGASFWDRLWRDGGYSFSLVFAWPVWDRGTLRARTAQAQLGLELARLRAEAARRDARLAWQRAQATMSHLYREIEILSRAAPDARDSYLQAESRYRGGAASALEVLDAYAASVEAAVRLSEATARYRVAEAVAIRWSTP